MRAAPTITESFKALTELVASERPDLLALFLEMAGRSHVGFAVEDLYGELDPRSRSRYSIPQLVSAILTVKVELNHVVKRPDAGFKFDSDATRLALLLSFAESRLVRTKGPKRGNLRKVIERLRNAFKRHSASRLVREFLNG